MITKFKLYEDLNVDTPKIGDYVIVKFNWSSSTPIQSEMINYLNDKIGIIRRIEKSKNDFFKMYVVEFDEKFPTIFLDVTNDDRIISFYKDEIKHWSKNREELEILTQANKYNL